MENNQASRSYKVLTENDHDQVQDNPNILSKLKRHKLATTVVVIAILLSLILCIVFLTNNNNNNNNKSSDTQSLYTAEDAAKNIEYVVRNVSQNVTQSYELFKEEQKTNVNLKTSVFLNMSFSLTEEQSETISSAFDVFDTNSDGYWNLSEFEAFSSELGIEKSMFSNIDIDNDDVLSFREMILTTKNQEHMKGSQYVYNNLMGPSVSHIYNVSRYTNEEKVNISDTWHQYAADLIMSNYDPGYKGFVTFSDYFSTEVESKFEHMDVNNDSLISLIEYSQGTLDFDKLKYASIYDILTVNSTQFSSTGLNSNGTNNLMQLQNETINYCPNMNRDGIKSGKGLHGFLNNYNDDDENDMEKRRLSWWSSWYYGLSCAWDTMKCSTSIAVSAVDGGATIPWAIYYCSSSVYDCYETIESIIS